MFSVSFWLQRILLVQGMEAGLSVNQVHPPTCLRRLMMPCPVAESHQMPGWVVAVGALIATSKGKVKVAWSKVSDQGTARPSCSS